jgi:hypothetical protein
LLRKQNEDSVFRRISGIFFWICVNIRILVYEKSGGAQRMTLPDGWHEDVHETKVSGRRRFLLGAAAAGGALIGAHVARAGEAAPPADPEW